MLKTEDYSLLQAKYSPLFSLAIQAAAYIISGMYGTITGAATLVIFLQLIGAGVIVMLMDELVQKGWGLGSGISLFIMAGVAQTVVWDTFSPTTGLFVGSLSAWLKPRADVFGLGVWQCIWSLSIFARVLCYYRSLFGSYLFEWNQN